MIQGGQRATIKVAHSVLGQMWALLANKISLTGSEDVSMILTLPTKALTKVIAPMPGMALPVVLILSLPTKCLFLVDQPHPIAVARLHAHRQLQMM